MRQRRLKAPDSFPVAYYHCLSRVVDRQFVFGELEREQFVRYLREYEAFCGVRVLTFCILSNHFHLLLEVPAKPAEPLSAEELIANLEALSSTALTAASARQWIEMFRQANDPVGEREFIERICASMWDVSEVQYFADGAVLGTRSFVDEVFTALRARFSPKRANGARPLAGMKSPLFTLRQLRERVFG